MIGLILITFGELFAQIGTSIGKYEVKHKKESFYGMAFLSLVFATIFLVLITVFWGGEFIFSLESLPTFSARVILEIIITFVSINAVIAADRSTFSFLKTLTIPLLLVVDLILGYNISLMHVIGLSVIAIALIFLFINHGLSRKGKMLSLFSALLAVGTISLYKYDITHFNSVEAEQIVLQLIVIIFVILIAYFRKKENVFKSLMNRALLVQSISSGIATVFMSFAYLFAPASIITATKRSVEILMSTAFGHMYFKEKKLGLKIGASVFLIAGVILMIF